MLRISKFKLTEVNRNIQYGQKSIKESSHPDQDETQDNAGKPPRSKSKNAVDKTSQQRNNFAKKKNS